MTEFGFKDILFGLAGVSMIAWVAIVGLWHTYMFPRFFKEDSSNGNSDLSRSLAFNSSIGIPSQSQALNPDNASTAIGLVDRSSYSKKSFVVANFNSIDPSYSVNRLYTIILLGLGIGTFVLLTFGLHSALNLILM